MKHKKIPTETLVVRVTMTRNQLQAIEEQSRLPGWTIDKVVSEIVAQGFEKLRFDQIVRLTNGE